MSVGKAFAVLALGFVCATLRLGGDAWILLWPALSSALVAVAYLANRPSLLGKRADGSRPLALTLLYLPVLLGLWVRWYAVRAFGGEPPWVEVVPGLWLGRRPLAGELPPGTALIVDLTAEWERAWGLGAIPHLQLPTLDGMAPEPAAFQRLVDALADDPRPAYVHCAAGHGRSALLVAALLVRRGVDDDPERALARLAALRPKVVLTRAQRRLLEVTAGPRSAR